MIQSYNSSNQLSFPLILSHFPQCLDVLLSIQISIQITPLPSLGAQLPHLILIAIERILKHTHIILPFLLRHIQHLPTIRIVNVEISRMRTQLLQPPLLMRFPRIIFFSYLCSVLMGGVDYGQGHTRFEILDYPVRVVALEHEFLVGGAVAIVQDELAGLMAFLLGLGDVEHAFVQFCADADEAVLHCLELVAFELPERSALEILLRLHYCNSRNNYKLFSSELALNPFLILLPKHTQFDNKTQNLEQLFPKYSMSGVSVCSHYRIDRLIRQDDLYPIYTGTNIQNNQPVAIKAEDLDARFSYNGYYGARLFYQGKVLQTLQGGYGVPSMYWCGQDHDYNFLVMERAGQNLEELFKKCAGRFSLKTVLMIGIETLNILQYYHFKGLVHRGVCPSNFAIGFGKKNSKIYIIDYSSTVRYRNLKTQTHINQNKRGFNNKNIHFSSINANTGIEGSRRDDMESWLYMLLYFYNGTLPWKGLTELTEQVRNYEILNLKKMTSLQTLYENMPRGFIQIAKHIKQLKFKQKPDYTYIRNLLEDMMNEIYEDFDKIYDWVLLPPVEYPQNLADSLILKLNTIPYEEKFLKEQQELYLIGVSTTNAENILKINVQASNLINTENTQMPFCSEMKTHQKECVLF